VWLQSPVRSLLRHPTARNSDLIIPVGRCRSDRCRVPAGSVAGSSGTPIRMTQLAMPTTTGSATWAKPDRPRTQLLGPAPPPGPPRHARLMCAVLRLPLPLRRSAVFRLLRALRWSAVFRLPRVLPRHLFASHWLTRPCRCGQQAPADCKPGRLVARRRRNLDRAAGNRSADGPRPNGRLRSTHRMAGRRWTTRCRAPVLSERDLSVPPRPVSTEPGLPAAGPDRPRGLMPIGPGWRGVRVLPRMAGPARCQPVPLLVGTCGRTESGALWPAWRRIPTLGPRRPPVRRQPTARRQPPVWRGRPPRCWT
jgi:hypothetical protein